MESTHTNQEINSALAVSVIAIGIRVSNECCLSVSYRAETANYGPNVVLLALTHLDQPCIKNWFRRSHTKSFLHVKSALKKDTHIPMTSQPQRFVANSQPRTQNSRATYLHVQRASIHDPGLCLRVGTPWVWSSNSQGGVQAKKEGQTIFLSMFTPAGVTRCCLLNCKVQITRR